MLISWLASSKPVQSRRISWFSLEVFVIHNLKNKNYWLEIWGVTNHCWHMREVHWAMWHQGNSLHEGHNEVVFHPFRITPQQIYGTPWIMGTTSLYNMTRVLLLLIVFTKKGPRNPNQEQLTLTGTLSWFISVAIVNSGGKVFYYSYAWWHDLTTWSGPCLTKQPWQWTMSFCGPYSVDFYNLDTTVWVCLC